MAEGGDDVKQLVGEIWNCVLFLYGTYLYLLGSCNLFTYGNMIGGLEINCYTWKEDHFTS